MVFAAELVASGDHRVIDLLYTLFQRFYVGRKALQVFDFVQQAIFEITDLEHRLFDPLSVFFSTARPA